RSASLIPRSALLASRVFGLRLPDAEFFEPVLEGPIAHTEHFGGLGNYPVGLIHCLINDVALEMLEINTFRWNFKPGVAPRALNAADRLALAYLLRQVSGHDTVALA